MWGGNEIFNFELTINRPIQLQTSLWASTNIMWSWLLILIINLCFDISWVLAIIIKTWREGINALTLSATWGVFARSTIYPRTTTTISLLESHHGLLAKKKKKNSILPGILDPHQKDFGLASVGVDPNLPRVPRFMW